MEKHKELLLELDKLKSVYRKSYLSDQSRNENSAEHSWHLAMAFMALKPLLPENLDIDHAIKLSLVHDVCEIGPGDVCAYHATNSKVDDEENYLRSLETQFPWFGKDVMDLWREYEAQQSPESHWVKVLDKFLPFLLNLASEGRTWQEQNINKDMVLNHNDFIKNHSPAIHDWMLLEIEKAVAQGWLAVS
jgi:putative hydrolase of HD superfamily